MKYDGNIKMDLREPEVGVQLLGLSFTPWNNLVQLP